LAGWTIWAPHEHAIHTCPLSKPPSRSPHRLWSSTKATRAGDRKRSGPSSSGDDRVSRYAPMYHPHQGSGPSGGYRGLGRHSSVLVQRHAWPAAYLAHPSRRPTPRTSSRRSASATAAHGTRTTWWVASASVGELAPPGLSRSLVREGRARRGSIREGNPSTSGGCRVCPQPPG